MNVSNCRGCGRLYNAITNTKLCPQCVNKLENKFSQVKEYLRENPNSSINKVSKEMDVSVKQIKQWVREERLVFSNTSVGGIECEQCGKIIRTGRFCNECKFKITSNLMSALDHPKVEFSQSSTHDHDRMRFLQSEE